MCEAVDNWLSEVGDEWEVQQHDCCPFNEILIPFVSLPSRDVHNCYWFSVTSPVHFNAQKKPILYLREDERMEEFRFIDNGIHFFLCDQSWWLDVFVCLATMNIITLSETKWHLWNKIYDDLFCQWRMGKNQKWNNVYFKCISDWF